MQLAISNGRSMKRESMSARVDQLAVDIEEQIAEGEAFLEDRPEYPIGSRIRSSTITVDDLLNASN